MDDWKKATEAWRAIARYKINSVLIVGDAMGRPLIEALEDNDDIQKVFSNADIPADELAKL